jgi:hypothetical protein
MNRIENGASKQSIAACVFIAAVTFLDLAKRGGSIYRHTDERDL